MRTYRVFWGGLCTVAAFVGMAGCQRSGSDTATPAPAAKEAAPEKGGDGEAAPMVQTVTARVGNIDQTLPVTGTVNVPRDAEATLSVPVAGVLDSLPVTFGQTVSRGQIVAHLSTHALRGQIQQAEALVAQNTLQVQQARTNALQQQGQTRGAILQAESAVSGARAGLLGAQATVTGSEAALAGARQSLARVQSLFGEGLVAKKDVEAAELAVHAAESQVAAQKQAVDAQRETVRGQEQATQAARAASLQNVVKTQDIAIAQRQRQSALGALETLRAQNALYTLRAPLSGTITVVGAGVGEAVDPTTKLLTISNLDRLQLQIAVPSASAAQVHTGMPVSFTVDALPGRTFRGTIRTVGSQSDPVNSTIAALATIDNKGHALKDDLFARIQIVLARHKNAVLLPRTAVLFATGDGGSPEASVLRVGADSILHKVTVTTGLTEGENIEILSGVRAGDRVATTGGYGLEDGTKVTIDSGEKDAGKDTGDGGDTKKP